MRLKSVRRPEPIAVHDQIAARGGLFRLATMFARNGEEPPFRYAKVSQKRPAEEYIFQARHQDVLAKAKRTRQ